MCNYKKKKKKTQKGITALENFLYCICNKSSDNYIYYMPLFFKCVLVIHKSF